jgi:predicted hydrocarbon binding protein
MSEKTFDRGEAMRVLEQTCQVIDQAGTIVSRMLASYANQTNDLEVNLALLHEIAVSLTQQEMASSRTTPWITRSEARALISLLSQLKQQLSASTLVKTCLDLTTQAKNFLEITARVQKGWGQDDYEEGDWDRFLSAEQLLTIAQWVDTAREDSTHDARSET